MKVQGPKTQTKANGAVVTGGSHDTKDSPLYFVPHLYHCVLPWTGTRFGLIAFTSSQVGSMTSEVREQLEKLKFRLPAMSAVAAPARHLQPRPTACTNQGGLVLRRWWNFDDNHTPTHLLPLINLITSVRDEGGAYIITKFSVVSVMVASLSDSDFVRLHRNLIEITELAHLFSTNFCVLLCGVVAEGFLDGLQVHATKHEDAFLVFAGLQAQQLKDRADEQLRLHDCTSQYHRHSSQHDAKECHGTKEHHDAKVSDLKVADLGPLHPPIDRALKVFSVASKACPCIAGHQTTPEISTVPAAITRLEAINKAREPFLLAPKSEKVRLEWCHHHLWAAVLGEEFSNTPDADWDVTVKKLYQGVAVQTALSVCLGERQQGYKALYEVCKINDEGLGRIQPGCNRGREKGAIIVSDSTLIFKAGARTFVEMAGDFEALQKPGHLLQQYTHLRQKAIWGGNLHSIVEAVLEAMADIVSAAKDPSCLEIDVTVVWMGNELCGRRGVFLDPGTPNWQIGPEGYAAEGIWPEIAGRVCGDRPSSRP